jgi:hypothetical protein
VLGQQHKLAAIHRCKCCSPLHTCAQQALSALSYCTYYLPKSQEINHQDWFSRSKRKEEKAFQRVAFSYAHLNRYRWGRSSLKVPIWCLIFIASTEGKYCPTSWSNEPTTEHHFEILMFFNAEKLLCVTIK